MDQTASGQKETMNMSDTIVQEITINSSADRIFAALTNPSEVVKWWGIEGRFQTTQTDADLRPGGRWTMRGIGMEGRPFTVTGQYRQVERPRLLVLTWLPDWQGDSTESTVRFDLEEKEGVTRVRLTHSGLTTENARASHKRWPQILCLLQGHVEPKIRPARAVTDGDIVLATVDVVMPPERVFRAMNSGEIEIWWGSADTYRMTEWKADLWVGGRWHVDVRHNEGIMPAGGHFLEIDAPRKIVLTRQYEWDFPQLGRRETRVIYRFDPISTGTRVTVRHEGFAGLIEPAEQHAEGWERVLGWLASYLETV
jgi:uncharacterized protein YndB with AHSA1/START domain